jgi:outer membrane protein assembly factor BamB
MSSTHLATNEGIWSVWSFDADAVRTDGVIVVPDGVVFTPNRGTGPLIGQFFTVWAVAWAVAFLGHATEKRLLATNGH